MSAPPGPLGVALRRRVLGMADTKRILGIRYSDWLLGAPSIEDGIACAGMAQDEWGHARLLYALLKEWGDDPVKVEQTRPPEEYANIGALDRPLEDWAEVVAVMFVVDGALTIALEGLSEGSFEPAKARIPKMVAEERFHGDLARAWTERLTEGSDEGRMRIREHIARLIPAVGAWVWPDDPPQKDIIRATYDTDGEELWDRWFERMREALIALDLNMPEPDRKGWSEKRGREPGMPDEETVERARGDRNRALFVE